MGADGASLKCPCGHSYPVPTDPAVKAVCPACQRPATTVNPAAESGPEPAVGLDRILIEKGWVTPEQVQAALAKQAEEAKQGRQMRLGEALVALGWAKPEQIREALTAQGRTPLRCPTCKKTFNVKVPKPGMRIMCKTCRVPLSVPGSITDLHADETGTSAQSSLVGESAEPSLADLLPGYALERKIATGGMGEVFLGRQKALDRPVAIKLLTRELAQDATYVQRFMAEARAAAKLRHENIVAAVDAGEAKGRYYFVMEYVQGETVQQIVKREGPLSEHRALEVARQIARGLKHAHQQGLIHRDIKSANIMIGLDGIAKICDFGLARELKVDVSTTQPGMVHSSPAYASPEQCRAVKLDHRSDMYSLGVTLFEMLTGQLPFKADVPSALFVAHATQTPPTAKSINGNVSAAANQLVARLLKKTAEARFKDYDDLLTALDQVEKAPIPGGTARTVAAPAPAGPGPAAKWAVIGIAATFVIVLAVALLRKGHGPETPVTAPVAVEEKGTDKLLKEARAFESARWGKPSEYPVVRAKWKALVDQYRGTPQHNQFAGPLLDFEARVEQESDLFAKDLEEKAKIRIDAGKISVALGQLRAFPAGYEGTPAAGRISGLVAQLEKTLDGRLAESKEQCWTLIAAEKFEDATKLIEDLRVTLGYLDERGPQFAKASYKEEVESLERKLEEERVFFARKRAAEAVAKNNPSPSPSPVPVPRPVTPEPPKPPPKVDPAPILLPADPPPAARRPAPGAAELKQAEDLVRDLFKEQYARKTPAAKVELARKMLDLARQTKDDPAGRFVLYREARDLAAAGGDADLANRAIDDLAREYEVNASSMKGVVLAELALNARTPDELKAAANAFLRLADESIEAKDYAGGERAANNAAQLARRAKDIPLVARATAKAKECADLKANPDKAAGPKAPAAGEVDLLSRIEPATDSLQGAWKASDGKLISPILLEPKFASCAVPYVPPEEYDLTLVAARRTGRSSLAVGLVAGGKQFDLELDGFEGASNRSFSGLDRVDGAWPPKGETAFRGGIFADQASHTVVVRIRKTGIVIVLDGQQVMSWTADYRRISAPHPLIAVKSPDSLFLAAWQSEYVIQRLTLKPVSGQGRFLDKRSAAIDLLALVDLKRDGLIGTWQQAGHDFTSPATGKGLIQIPYIAPEEFDLRLVVRMSQQAEVSVGIALGEIYFLLTVDGWDGRFCGIDQIDGKGSDVNETSRPGRVLKNDVPNTINCSIRKNRVKLEVNGEILVDWPMARNRLSLSSYWERPRNGQLTIGGHNGYTISRYELIPVTGQGKPLR